MVGRRAISFTPRFSEVFPRDSILAKRFNGFSIRKPLKRLVVNIFGVAPR
jgi:hypothetical protein